MQEEQIKIVTYFCYFISFYLFSFNDKKVLFLIHFNKFILKIKKWRSQTHTPSFNWFVSYTNFTAKVHNFNFIINSFKIYLQNDCSINNLYNHTTNWFVTLKKMYKANYIIKDTPRGVNAYTQPSELHHVIS